MSIPDSYLVQNGCRNCRRVFCRRKHDFGDELYCMFGESQRPPYGSDLIREWMNGKVESLKGALAEWDAWANVHLVSPAGKCDHFEPLT